MSARADQATSRADKARANRRRMRAAALALFADRGYASTSMQAIADEAGVAVQTLYFTFGTKRALLSEILDIEVAGDEEPVPTLERPGVLAAIDDPDRERQLREQARIAREIYQRVAPVLQVVANAASADPELAELWETNNTQRATVMERLISALAAKGPLRDGLDTAMAIDIALALQSPEMYQYLTKRRGWSPSRWEQWTADALITQLLPSR
ncbi:TetR family transcriptional regulator [Kribbella orskensis]|uniref:TetR family transcriptional regulator n=1 Tax=Kribbella orskensis TaxID=2512216 RepID=A0ABY2BDQ6_9ACTN|nr:MULTISPECIES: TetR/AcrR family transcriptional regulator [Kribbella]TCN35593.1 TetR family transcriptional regulator [Kribbella sp. VKM Ac-2500]TCO17135.1 TetR family transcriptional regulator [Kribbella orskensis]